MVPLALCSGAQPPAAWVLAPELREGLPSPQAHSPLPSAPGGREVEGWGDVPPHWPRRPFFPWALHRPLMGRLGGGRKEETFLGFLEPELLISVWEDGWRDGLSFSAYLWLVV